MDWRVLTRASRQGEGVGWKILQTWSDPATLHTTYIICSILLLHPVAPRDCPGARLSHEQVQKDATR